MRFLNRQDIWKQSSSGNHTILDVIETMDASAFGLGSEVCIEHFNEENIVILGRGDSLEWKHKDKSLVFETLSDLKHYINEESFSLKYEKIKETLNFELDLCFNLSYGYKEMDKAIKRTLDYPVEYSFKMQNGDRRGEIIFFQPKPKECVSVLFEGSRNKETKVLFFQKYKNLFEGTKIIEGIDDLGREIENFYTDLELVEVKENVFKFSLDWNRELFTPDELFFRLQAKRLRKLLSQQTETYTFNINWDVGLKPRWSCDVVFILNRNPNKPRFEVKASIKKGNEKFEATFFKELEINTQRNFDWDKSIRFELFNVYRFIKHSMTIGELNDIYY